MCRHCSGAGAAAAAKKKIIYYTNQDKKITYYTHHTWFLLWRVESQEWFPLGIHSRRLALIKWMTNDWIESWIMSHDGT